MWVGAPRKLGSGARWAPLLAVLGCAPSPPPADLVFVGGPVWTVDPSRPWADALAVRGELIVFVGSRSGVESLVGATTRRVDLDGRLLLPGLGDEELVAIHEAASAENGPSVEAAIASHVSGKLVPGSPADLTVLQENILRILPERVAETKIEMMVVRGSVVYVAATFDHPWSPTLE